MYQCKKKLIGWEGCIFAFPDFQKWANIVNKINLTTVTVPDTYISINRVIGNVIQGKIYMIFSQITIK